MIDNSGSHEVPDRLYTVLEVSHMIKLVAQDPRRAEALILNLIGAYRGNVDQSVTEGKPPDYATYSPQPGFMQPSPSTPQPIDSMDDPMTSMQGISYDKSQSRYRASYKKGQRLVQRVFSIKAHGAQEAKRLAVNQRNAWIDQGLITPREYRLKRPVKRSKPAVGGKPNADSPLPDNDWHPEMSYPYPYGSLETMSRPAEEENTYASQGHLFFADPQMEYRSYHGPAFNPYVGAAIYAEDCAAVSKSMCPPEFCYVGELKFEASLACNDLEKFETPESSDSSGRTEDDTPN